MLWPSSEEGELVHLNLPLTYEQWDSQRKMWLSRESKVQPCHTWGRVFERKKYGEVVLIYVTTAECRGTDSDVIHWDRRRVKTFTRSPCHFWYLIPRIFPLFVLYWPIYSLLRVKILHKKKESVWAIVYFFKNGAHVNFPAERGGECFYICHSSINTPAAWRLFLPLSLPPSLSLSISLSGFLKLSLSLNVRWEEAARIIGHASVGLFDRSMMISYRIFCAIQWRKSVTEWAKGLLKGTALTMLCALQRKDGGPAGKGSTVSSADGSQFTWFSHRHRLDGVGDGSCRIWEAQSKNHWIVFVPFTYVSVNSLL